mgnify:CR=1 FL=1
MEKWSEHKINATIELSTLESPCIDSLNGLIWGKYHKVPSLQLTSLQNQIFQVKNWNPRSSVFVAKPLIFKTRRFWSPLSSHFKTNGYSLDFPKAWLPAPSSLINEFHCFDFLRCLPNWVTTCETYLYFRCQYLSKVGQLDIKIHVYRMVFSKIPFKYKYANYRSRNSTCRKKRKYEGPTKDSPMSFPGPLTL